MEKKLLGTLHVGTPGRVNVEIDLLVEEDGSHFNELRDILQTEILASDPGTSVLLQLTIVG